MVAAQRRTMAPLYPFAPVQLSSRSSTATESPLGRRRVWGNHAMDGKQQSGSRARGYRRVLLIVAGSLCLALGVIGVIVPVLPTTPFLILAAICYARSSERGHRWLMSNRIFGTYLRDYLEGRGLSWRTTVSALVLLWGGPEVRNRPVGGGFPDATRAPPGGGRSGHRPTSSPSGADR